ncbi:iron-containing redox enzyme family protein [bacterium]|nr:iron-containing redox enzyme family protein [bacterium]
MRSSSNSKFKEVMEMKKEMSFQEFKKVYSENMEAYHKSMVSFPWEDVEAYKCWLAQTYYYVSFSSRIISLSAALLPLSKSKLHSRCVTHSAEESNHEILAQRDLQALGGCIEDYPELPSTSALYQSQYFHCLNDGADSLMGYFISLEGLAIKSASEAAQRVFKNLENPKAVNFLRVHGDEDIEHVEKAIDVLKSFSPVELYAAAKNLKRTREYYCQMLEECYSWSKEIGRAA